MKRLLKLLISLAVRGSDLLRSGLLRLVGRQPRPLCVVLYYHGIPASRRERFARQMDEVLRLTKPIPAGLRQPLNGAPRYCAVTFDDGFVSVLENALPELEGRRLPSTWFVPSGCLGQPPPWIKNSASSASREQILSEKQLATFKDHPLVTIGSHTISHPRLTELSEAACLRELRQSRVTLEEALGQTVTLFSFPHGKYNPRVLELAKAAGYQRVFTIAPARALATADEFVTGRVLADPADWPLEFRLKLLGAYRWLACFAARN